MRHRVIAIGLFAVTTLAPAAVVRERGVDVSHYQGESGVSQTTWNSVKAAGASFTFIKATEGLTGPDDGAMPFNVARADAAGLYTGVYHYAHPENRNSVAGAILEANHLLTIAGSAIGPGHLRPALDIEGRALNLSTTDLTSWIIAFCDQIVAQRGPAARPIIYMSQFNAFDEIDSRLADYDAWLASPDTGYDPNGPLPYSEYFPNPAGVFNNWAFWQYSFRATNGALTSDGDVVHSEYRGLAEYLIPVPEPMGGVMLALAGIAMGRRRIA